MDDRGLLELAAKAAGIEGDWSKTIGGWDCLITRPGSLNPWQPLHDDGDALRLAVKLGMNVYSGYTEICVEIPSDSEASPLLSVEPEGSDPYAATRRAIVRAAAEIGKGIVTPNVEFSGGAPLHGAASAGTQG